MTYQEALEYVAGLAPRGWRLGLDRMREFARRAGLDDCLGADGGPQFIHVAGTNGKGSTTAYLQSILHESGYRTGAFFSPYVVDPRERIQLGRELIPEKIFAGLTAMLIPIAEDFTETEYGGISEFEFKTAMALLFYKRLKCEWVALEVGLGGRLDATNIVTPRASVIVSIGLDHTNVLGHSLGEIAAEKAGIIKAGIPVVAGGLPPEAMAVVEHEATVQGAELWRFEREIQLGYATDGSLTVTTPRGKHAGLRLGISGAMQAHNLALAVAACDAAGVTRTLGGLQRGSARATIPGRFEIRQVQGKTIVLDGAHNRDAARVLIETLREYRPNARILMITGMVAGHDPRAFYEPFSGVVEGAVTVPIDSPRALTPEEVAEALTGIAPVVRSFDSVSAGLREALREASENDVILVTGSFYLVGQIGRLLTPYEY